MVDRQVNVEKEMSVKMAAHLNTSAVKVLRIASFNCEGYNELKQAFIKKLLNNVDILLLQEFWLIPTTLNKLSNLSDQFQCHAISAVDDTEILHGRPYGGVAILWHKRLRANVELIQLNSKRLSAIKRQSLYCSILIVSVYLPCDTYAQHAVSDEFQSEIDVLDVLDTVIQDTNPDHILIGGDFNTSSERVSAQTNVLRDFCTKWTLKTAWDMPNHVRKPTYYFSDVGPKSTHFKQKN